MLKEYLFLRKYIKEIKKKKILEKVIFFNITIDTLNDINKNKFNFRNSVQCSIKFLIKI